MKWAQIDRSNHTIVNVLTILASVRTGTCANAEQAIGDKVRPLVVLQIRAESVPVY